MPEGIAPRELDIHSQPDMAPSGFGKERPAPLGDLLGISQSVLSALGGDRGSQRVEGTSPR